MGWLLGIDPGKEGCVAAVSRTTREIVFHDCPVYKDGKKEHVDVRGCADLLMNYVGTDMELITMERVHAMPKNGSISAFSLGYSYGVWLGIINTLQLPHKLVTPQAWKKSMMPGELKEKDSSRVVAVRLFPHSAGQLKLVKHHNRADALLIACFGGNLLC